MDAPRAEWMRAPAPVLLEGIAHVWRIDLGRHPDESDWALLSPEEERRAHRFFADRHRMPFVVAHSALRRILARYTSTPAHALTFLTAENGKPWVDTSETRARRLEFNLSHSGAVGLVAVARGHRLGVDVERWDTDVEHLELAERFFSPSERHALRSLAHSPPALIAGFFAAWSRKEAYLKATGHGISRGLHHFDVSVEPGEPARLLADRLEPHAVSRWAMTELLPADGYSAALVFESAVREILLFDAE